MKRLIAVLVVAIGAVGCERPAEEQVRGSNSEVKVERLTTFDDCVLYRIQDTRTVYIARCGRSTYADSSYYQSSGKSGHWVYVESQAHVEAGSPIESQR